MKELVVLSGKGGTGKTTVCAALAIICSGRVLAVDTDVDAANLHLVLQPQSGAETPFIGGRMPHLDEERCTGCGICSEVCRFHAMSAGRVRLVSCEGCGLCALACPEQALRMTERLSGCWSVGAARCGTLVQARLLPGEGNSGKLVSLLKEEARKLAGEQQVDWLLCDGSPGIGCPTMAALAGSDALLAVAEPSASGLHDLRRLFDLAERFAIPAYACINKADLAPEFADAVRVECRRRSIPLLVEIPYDERVSACARRGFTVLDAASSPAARAFTILGARLARALKPAAATVAAARVHP